MLLYYVDFPAPITWTSNYWESIWIFLSIRSPKHSQHHLHNKTDTINEFISVITLRGKKRSSMVMKSCDPRCLSCDDYHQRNLKEMDLTDN